LPVSGEHQAKLTLMSESLRNDGRVWVPRHAGDRRSPDAIPEAERDYYLERLYPRYGNLAPRDIASRAAKAMCDQGRGVEPGGRAVFLDLSDAVSRIGVEALRERYGNLIEMYERLTGDDPLRTPLRIYPAAHYTMGGLWVDYDLMTSIPGLFAIGEANFSDHGANRLGASALMQALADGYFVLPNAVGGYLSGASLAKVHDATPEVRAAVSDVGERVERLLRARGKTPAAEFHRQLGRILWEACGLARKREGLAAAIPEIGRLRARFSEQVSVPGSGEELNQELERAGRIEDFLELGELMCADALARNESAGCHFREEHQTSDGEPQRDDANYAHVAVFSYAGVGRVPERFTEPLVFDFARPETRNYR
jgi:succinate dehydrogenase / fumarate reductase flavoprotein subunit